jgi:hypothetical protein
VRKRLISTPLPSSSSKRLCRNVILRSEATRNLLFAFVVSEHQRGFDTSTGRKADPSLALRMTRARFFGLRHSLEARGRRGEIWPQKRQVCAKNGADFVDLDQMEKLTYA